jgi:Amt family ammonium transporter|tara:strand:+ start:236 stop:1465 length:1230 start_codon:yes stop_codon:yes gene_type:complete
MDELIQTIDSGNTAWILTASALVLFMTIPGLSFFYAGLVRKKNVLSVLMHCFVLTCVMTILWLVYAYSGCFAEDGKIFGSAKYSILNGLGAEPHGNADTIPHELFFIFQMTFFIITPALMVGAFVERIKFSAMLWFTGLWALLVYVPACHTVWGGGIFGEMGVQDFAGGIVVHITAGVGALVACIVLGPRKGYPDTQMMPHNLPMTVAGTGMLWVGWFGFNGGSAVAADGSAATAIVVTQISAATAALTWMFIEWFKHGKPSVLGIVTGSIAGLAAITPASGVVGPQGALIIGLVSGFICWYASTAIKAKFGYDDSLDVFGVHGVGGFIGTLLLAFLGAKDALDGRGDFVAGSQFVVQLKAALAVGTYTFVVTWVILKVVDAMVGLRVDEQDENSGLDVSAHGEAGYND